ncbi:flagellin B, partial [Helicobacter pylori]
SQHLGFTAIGFGESQVAETTVNLRDVTGNFNANVKSASGANYNAVIASGNQSLGSGVTTLRGAMVVIDIAESAMKMLDKVRSDLGSVQNQMISTVNNISITQVNVKAAESQIRDVDFAEESANFNKNNILAQSGSYAMSQANTVQQNILRLLT